MVKGALLLCNSPLSEVFLRKLYVLLLFYLRTDEWRYSVIMIDVFTFYDIDGWAFFRG